VKPGDYVQPYMVDHPYALFPSGLLVAIESKIKRFGGRKRMDKNREYVIYHVLTSGEFKVYEQPFWELRKFWYEDIGNLSV